MSFEIQTVCVCGAGTMGSGIAQVCASANYTTIVYDVNEEMLQKAKTKIESDLQRLAEKQKISAGEIKQTLAKIQFTSNIQHCIADLVIEAVVENIDAKLSLFAQLLRINSPQTIYASNTSSLSITKIADLLQYEQLIGLHFFNPAPLMKLVEIVKTNKTDAAIIQGTFAFVQSLNKTPVVCKDSPGFIVNRVARPFYIESLRVAESEISFEIIDQLLEARGFKMGPFKLMDLIGNDINYTVSCSVYELLNKPERLKPSFIQKEKVEKNELGKKTGKGYYQY